MNDQSVREASAHSVLDTTVRHGSRLSKAARRAFARVLFLAGTAVLMLAVVFALHGSARIVPLQPGPLLTFHADSNAHPHRSDLKMFEDGVALGPAHALHVDIAARGGGRYSHWGSHLYFSSSDGTDPAANGRLYSVETSAYPSFGLLGALLAAGLLLVLAGYASAPEQFRTLGRSLCEYARSIGAMCRNPAGRIPLAVAVVAGIGVSMSHDSRSYVISPDSKSYLSNPFSGHVLRSSLASSDSFVEYLSIVGYLRPPVVSLWHAAFADPRRLAERMTEVVRLGQVNTLVVARARCRGARRDQSFVPLHGNEFRLCSQRSSWNTPS